MITPEQYGIRGSSTSEIAASIERAIRDGKLAPGTALPTVRATARALRVSPTTASAAYREARTRGLLQTHGRRGTRVSHRPPLPVPAPVTVPAGLRNLAWGNPDPDLLPPLGPVLARLAPRPRLYGQPPNRRDLVDLAARELRADGVPRGTVAVVGGALDGLERVLQAHLRPGDRVAVEDPGYSAVFDLLGALGLVLEPVAVDDSGPVPRDVERALGAGARALVVTPRAQNPTGAALDAARVRALRPILDARPDLLLVEDDHAGPVAGAPARTLAAGRSRWALLRSVSKSLGPDLRLAILTGDAETVSRVEGRQLVGTGWVSHVLQAATVALWKSAAVRSTLRRAAAAYGARRDGMLRALAARGIAARGRSGLNVWVPVPEETAAVTALANAGFAIRAGERYRLKSPPAVRITIAALRPGEAEQVADALGQHLGAGGSRTG